MVNGKVIDGHYVVDIYRGSDTTQVEGISWWTTDRVSACEYMGHFGKEGLLMHRTIRIPMSGNFLCNPHRYLIGGRVEGGFQIISGAADLDHYYYGLSREVLHVERMKHFCISIHHTILEGLTLTQDMVIAS